MAQKEAENLRERSVRDLKNRLEVFEQTFRKRLVIAKKRRLRVLELSPNCIAWLKTVPNRTGRLSPGKYTVRWAEFVKAAGFPDWGKNRSNAMRHSFGSYHYAMYSDAAKTSSIRLFWVQCPST